MERRESEREERESESERNGGRGRGEVRRGAYNVVVPDLHFDGVGAQRRIVGQLNLGVVLGRARVVDHVGLRHHAVEAHVDERVAPRIVCTRETHVRRETHVHT